MKIETVKVQKHGQTVTVNKFDKGQWEAEGWNVKQEGKHTKPISKSALIKRAKALGIGRAGNMSVSTLQIKILEAEDAS